MLTIKQLAAKACLSARTVRALLDAKAFPCAVRDGQRLVKWEDFETFVATTGVSEWFTEGNNRGDDKG